MINIKIYRYNLIIYKIKYGIILYLENINIIFKIKKILINIQ